MKQILFILGATALLAACGGEEQNASAPPCPPTVIVQQLAEVTQFKPGEGRDLTDVVMEGKLAGFDGFCETDFGEGEAGEVTVRLRIVFTMSRGPANTERKGRFSYFVMIADQIDKPVQKHVFESDVAFPGNRNRIAPFEELSLTVPLKSGENGGNYNVLIGFQLTPEQVEYSRSQIVR